MSRFKSDGKEITMTTEKHLTLLAVHAHPDDEVFGTGGVLTRAAAEGIHTVLVCSTKGENGEIHDPALDPEEARPRLAAIREEELRRAVEILGVDDLIFLGYRDSGMVGTPENADPRNFHNADPDEAVGRVVAVIRRVKPEVVVTYDPRGSYGHPDHIAAHKATVAAFDAAADPARYPEQGLAPWQAKKLYYTALSLSGLVRMGEVMRERGVPIPFGEDFDPASIAVPDEQITTRVDVGDYMEQKRAALRVHKTQIAEDHFTAMLPDDMLRGMLGTETFIRAKSLVDAPLPEDDLFAGLPRSS